MSSRAAAIAHGAATIVNAIALGQGAAFGVDLWTKAEVQLTEEPMIIRGEITSDLTESNLLIEKTVSQVFRYFGLDHFGAKVRTSSNIPIARGLKSSSTAANAVALATTAALSKELDDLTVVNLGVDAAFDAKVTITGAFDDACASYFGGVVITDNMSRKILQKFSLPEGLTVLFHIPSKKAYTGATDVNKLSGVKLFAKVALEEASKGNFWMALSLNGTIYSAALGYDNSTATDALSAGALAAGLCGKGPAVTAVVEDDKLDSVKVALQRHEGEVLEAHFNSEKARVLNS
ncbi:MAG TPA: shikimate kinase [Candidatus Sulfotelmatobacter sp.]|nr:shikimate kinase [Candidatus Sulfotelmatobacter sp.]